MPGDTSDRISIALQNISFGIPRLFGYHASDFHTLGDVSDKEPIPTLNAVLYRWYAAVADIYFSGPATGDYRHRDLYKCNASAGIADVDVCSQVTKRDHNIMVIIVREVSPQRGPD